ncbi:hypothetical protein BJ878DRAFT_540392 [Calycina marina]|uniref:GAR domain-containing protein n=1 Tax=Calycina marina TaxID=1763456 RepID=A0A9P7Z6V0_9HELO|nr:hypothetical protein BJ878DRAFT_540392 [Calycina marina]
MDSTKTPLSSVPRFNRRLSPYSAASSPTITSGRQRYTDDILSDLSPTSTFEAFTTPSGKLRDSIEAATPVERAFGIRATLASKKIQEWVIELSAWPWPENPGPEGFELPTVRRRKLAYRSNERQPRSGYPEPVLEDIDPSEYMGSLPTHDVLAYEVRIEEIQEDMDDLNVEEIKRTVLNNYFSSNSRPSSASSTLAPPSFDSGPLRYTKMDDFAAVVAATVLHALPNLSRLTCLMEVWSTRLGVLRKVPSILGMLNDAEVALQSGWQAFQVPGIRHSGEKVERYLERATFEVMRNVLQDKVTTLGRDLDRMLDRLEGREDTLPEHWLDRMEALETDYGSWVVSGDRKVREGEWARLEQRKKEKAKQQKKDEDSRKVASLHEEQAIREREEQARLVVEAARLKAELARKEREEDMRLERLASEKAAMLEEQRVQKIIDDEIRSRIEQQESAAKAARKGTLRNADQVDGPEVFESSNHAGHFPYHPLSSERPTQIVAFDGVPDSQDYETSDDRPMSKDVERTITHQHKIRPKFDESLQSFDGNSESKIEPSYDYDPYGRPGHGSRAREKPTSSEIGPGKRNPLPDETLQVKQRHSPESRWNRGQWLIDEDLMQGLSGGLRLDDATEARLAKKFGNKNETNTHKYAGISDSQVARNAAFMKKHNLKPQRTRPGRRTEASEFDGTDDIDDEDEVPDNAVEVPSQNQGSSTAVGDGLRKIVDSKHTPDSEQPPSPVQHFRRRSIAGIVDAVFPTRMRSPTNPSKRTPLSRNASMRARADSSTAETQTSLPPSPSDLLRFNNATSWVGSPLAPEETVVKMRASVSSQGGRSQQTVMFIPSPKAEKSAELPPQVDGSLTAPQNAILATKSKPGDSYFDRPAPSKRHSRNFSLVSGYSITSPSPELRTAEPGKYLRHNVVVTPTKPARSEPITPEVISMSPTMVVGEVMPSLASPSSSDDPSEAEPPSINSFDGMNESKMNTHELGEIGQCYTPDRPKRSSRVLRKSISKAVPVLAPSKRASLQTLRTADGIPPPNLNGLSTKIAQAISEQPTALPNLRIEDLPVFGDGGSAMSTLTSPLPCQGYECACVCPRCTAFSPSNAKTPDEEPAFDNSWTESQSADRRNSLSIESPQLPEHRKSVSESLITDRIITGKGSPIIRPNMTTIVADIPPTVISINSAPTSPVRSSSPNVSHPVGSTLKNGITTDDQMQAQLSSLLKSIPTNIRLNNESAPEIVFATRMAPSNGDSLQVRKSRCPLPKYARPSSSLSTHSPSSLSVRSTTPAFTLQPVSTKNIAHHYNTHSDIRVYHLSRHDDAPIKLHIRRVGEHGDRLMVRTGGGWADLGEYLTAYISHHGRRIASGTAEDKVEVQNLGAGNRSVSRSGTTPTVRPRNISFDNGGGRESPVHRPSSVMGTARPQSSFTVRKVRRSIGEVSGQSKYDPTTPRAATAMGHSAATTPLSESSIAASRISWTESPDDRNNEREPPTPERLEARSRLTSLGGLGMAGPNSGGKKQISHSAQEWVRSTTEKVRVASAEKEREKANAAESRRGSGWGEEKRRLFKQ